MIRPEFTKEVLEKAVKQNTSILGTMSTLGVSLKSGSLRKKVTRFILEYEIDTSYFLGQSWNNGKGPTHKGGIIKKIVIVEDERKCLKCNLTKLAGEFYCRKKGPKSGEFYEKCKDCMKIRGRLYYHQNVDRQLSLARIRKQRYTDERRQWLKVIKDKPCIDCGVKYPDYVMDFDHIDSRNKIASISWMALHNTSNLETIKKEIEKCELVCSNCHRIRTNQRLQKNRNAAVANVVKAEV